MAKAATNAAPPALVGVPANFPEDIKNDARDVSDLWREALKNYKGIVGFDLERKYDNVQSMLDQGTVEMKNFHRFRHNEKKVDRLRTLFAENLDYLETGAQQLIAAAVPSFPPAAAIGTALTYLLSACRQVSADYDTVVVFFEDMNSFLQRIVILETRMPVYKAYQNCLMDVFTSFLTMCGFAHKYIELGRFKKWISNLLMGAEDSELGGARKSMDKQLARLQSATEFAILGNTEELQRMSTQLDANQQAHSDLLREQMEVMGSIRDSTETIQSDLAKLLRAVDEQRREQRAKSGGGPGAGPGGSKAAAPEQGKPSSAKRIRNMLQEIEDEDHEYFVLKDSLVSGTCTWVFSEPEWHKWTELGPAPETTSTSEPAPELVAEPAAEPTAESAAESAAEPVAEPVPESTSGPGTAAEPAPESAPGSVTAAGPRPPLYITGDPGFGKSHIGVAIYQELLQQARQDTSHRSCAAHFYFREQSPDQCAMVFAVTTIIVQVVEQSPLLCEMINAEWARDEVSVDVYDWENLTRKLLAPAFRKGGETHLALMLDGIDEIDEKANMAKFLKIVHEEELRISIVMTCRPSMMPSLKFDHTPLKIEVAKEKQAQDLKTLIWNRIDKSNVLRMFGRYVKQRIADKVEVAAPNMLYAEHMLANFNALGREGAVLHRLEQPFPADLDGLYEHLLRECYRRTNTANQEHVLGLLHWIAHCYRPMTLNEVASLLRYWSADAKFDMEDIPEPFAKFLVVGDLGTDAEARADIKARGRDTTAQDLEKEESGGVAGDGGLGAVYDDGVLPVKFRERSMRSFFRGVLQQKAAENGSPALRRAESEVHRRIIVDLAKMLENPLENPLNINDKLRGYAAEWIIDHWLDVHIDKHSDQEAIEALEALGALFTNKHNYAYMMEKTWEDTDYDHIIFNSVFDQMETWGKHAASKPDVGALLSPAVAEWWAQMAEKPKDGLLQLAKGHVQRIFQADDLKAATLSYRAVLQALQQSGRDGLLAEQAAKNHGLEVKDDESIKERDGALGIEGLFEDLTLDTAACRSIASLLLKYTHRKEAQATCQKGLDMCPQDDIVEAFKLNELMAKILLKRVKVKVAQQHILACVGHFENDAISPSLKRQAMVTKARIESWLDDYAAAAASYEKARKLDPANITPGDTLDEEMVLFSEKDGKAACLACLKKWTPLERLTWMCHEYEDGDKHYLLRDIVAETGELDFVLQAYHEAIHYLDAVNAGAPLRISLAQLHMQVSQDLVAARKALDEVLDSGSSGWPYALTDEAPDDTLTQCMDVQADVLYRLFCESRDPAVKAELISAVRAFLTRPLALDVPPNADTYMLHHRLVLARMYLKMGPAAEFQATLEGIVDTCVAGLSDKVGWNDRDNLLALAAALSILADAVSDSEAGKRLDRMVKLVHSARFNQLDPAVKDSESDDDDDDDSESESQWGSDIDNMSDGDDESEWGTEASGEADGDGDDGEGEDEEIPGDDENADEEGGEDGDGDENGEGSGENDDSGTGSGSDDEDEEEPTNEGDLGDSFNVGYTCEGTCTSSEYCWWGSRVAYQCVVCCEGFLCEDCYTKLKSDEGLPPNKRHFCGRGHRHIKGPIEGWQGVKEGMVQMEGEEPVPFTELLRKIKDETCKEAWDAFWEG